MSELARLVVPALRWDRAHGFQYLDGLIDDALELGVGGFMIVNGPRDAVAALAGRLHADSRHPIVIGVPSECGAGHAVEGLTHLPPFAALSTVALVQEGGVLSLNAEPVRRAARLTARELRNVGANWSLAPFSDAGRGVRPASGDPAVVATVVSEWVDACQAESVISTAIGYPGADDRPFAAAVDAGAAAVMIANARAPRLIESTLRGKLGFDGLVVSSPLDSDAAILPGDEKTVVLEAFTAGCDLIVAPGDLGGAVDALSTASALGRLPRGRVRAALDRVDRWSGWARPAPASETSLDDVMWARQLADASLKWVRGQRPRIGASAEVIRLCAAGDHLLRLLRAAHVTVAESAQPSAGERGPLLVLCDSAGAGPEASRLAQQATAAGRDAAIIALIPPADARVPGDTAVLSAWEPTQPMEEAAARALVRGA